MQSEDKIIKFSKNFFQNFNNELKKIDTLHNLEQLKSKYLGKNTKLSSYFKKLITFNLESRIKYSIILNNLKKKIFNKIKFKKKYIKNLSLKKNINSVVLDPSLPGKNNNVGSLHPITLIIEKITRFFKNLNFIVYYGPELEDSYHNFDALNISEDHPSRNNSDTFWFNTSTLLRTHTSSVQIRALENNMFPAKIIFPGKVYRNDYDNTHTPMFHQIEGLIIEKCVSFANLKWMLQEFIKFILPNNYHFRFRGSYFPFTTPSAEMDIKLQDNKWLEILGCGMVHPDILERFNINSDKYSACAFGVGVERIAMIKYCIPDIRSFFLNDIRFLKQFRL